MNLRMLRHFLNGGVIVVRLLFIVLFMLWSQGQADAQIIIVPIEEVKFEAPALPPPLWRTNLLVMKELALPAMQTFSEKATTAAPKFSLMPSTVRTVLSYEHVSGDFGRTTSNEGEGQQRKEHEIEFDGDVVSIYSKIAWNTHRISVGTMIFYDSLGLDSFDMHRVGIMFFGKHQWPISQSLDIGLTANGNYARNIMDSRIDNVDFQDFNTFGGNISISLEFDTQEIYRAIAISEPKISRLYFAGGLSLSYQFQKDDVERESFIFSSGEVVQEVDDQHLLMLGANFGMRMGSRFAMSIYGIWNYDATEYKGSLRDTDDNYLDVILEGSWSPLPEGKVNFGYKRILFYQEIDSNQIFVGISWRF